MNKGTAEDPKGLISEAYKIEGITAEECRSIFMDWTFTAPDGEELERVLRVLKERYGVPGHPMTEVLEAALQPAERPRRRGGWRSRDR